MTENLSGGGNKGREEKGEGTEVQKRDEAGPGVTAPLLGPEGTSLLLL